MRFYLLRPPSTTKCLKRISKEVLNFWNLPHVAGGKRIAIDCLKNIGPQYYSYKEFFFQVLLAVCDANYKFTFIDADFHFHFSRLRTG